MPLATKNNALIVNDGKVAENCNCCAGWYCCEDRIGQCRDRLGDVLKLTATISAQDYKKHDLVSGCRTCENGQETWTCGTYLWPGSKYAGTFVLTPRRIVRPMSNISNVENGVWWLYEHMFPADDAGCTNANISVWVNVRIPADPFQSTPSTRLEIQPLALSGRVYRHFKSSAGSPSPVEKSLSDMKCERTASGPASVCSGGVREFYDSTNDIYGPGQGTPLIDSSIYFGLCGISFPIETTGPSFSLGGLGSTSCGYDAGGGPQNYSVISETGSLQVSGSLLIEEI